MIHGADMSPKRVHLPVDFDGPICAKCVHIQGGVNWTCMAGDPVVLHPAGTNPITGLVYEAEYEHRPLCADRNERGDCKDFQRKAGSVP